MATRQTTHILKNSDIVNRPLPSSLLKGEPIINTADGVMFFSGFTTSTSEWTPAGTGATANFFEVGSNLYDLRLRNRITKYEGQTGIGLSGKFLSGTTNGFVLANITDIATSIDSYTTGATWSPNTLTIGLNNGKPSVPVTIDSFNNLNLYGTTNVNGDLTITGTTGLQGVTATNINASNLYASSTISAVTGNITTINSSTGNFNNLSVTGTEIVNNLTITGTGLYNNTATLSNEIVNYGLLTSYTESNDTYVTGGTVTVPATNSSKSVSIGLTYKNSDGIPHILTTENTFTTGGTYNNSNKLITFVKNDSTNYTVDLSSIDTNDTYVTGGTNTSSTNNTNSASIGLKYNQDIPDGTYSLPYTNTYVTGGTYNSGTITFTKNDSTTFQVTGIDGTDTYVTGFTYTASNNSLVISRNQGELDLPVYINSFSGLTISNLTPGQVVYAGTGGELKTDSTGEFAYNDSTNVLTLGITSGNLIVNNGLSDGPSTFGQGGVTIGSGGTHITPGFGNLTVHGNLVVFGTATTVSTNELYVEDPQITLNYNPSGDTSVSSISSGIRIQDGDGQSGDTYFTIAQLNTLTGLTSTQTPIVTEYTNSGIGNSDRGWLTQLNDIVIRNNNFNNGAPNGVRVLAEFDVLDGGTY